MGCGPSGPEPLPPTRPQQQSIPVQHSSVPQGAQASGHSAPAAAAPAVARKPPKERDVNSIVVPKGFIHPRDLPSFDPFREEQPDWRWEKEEGQWRSYPLADSIELDRYWQVWSTAAPPAAPAAPGNEAQNGDGMATEEGPATKAKLKLLKNDVVVDFSQMTAQAAEGRPRKIERKVKTDDWLSNRFFFDAFIETLHKAGIKVETAAEQMFEFRYVQDFRETRDDGRKMYRGGREYHLPVGWKRFAVNVKGMYDDGDNAWLREDESGWAVAYHGTSKEGLGGILSTGFRVGERQKFAASTGAGVYCTPIIDVAQHYSKPTLLRGHSVQIVLQLRVKPSGINPVTTPGAHEFEKKYWVINNPDEIRAYGVLIRELPLRDYILPEIMVFGRDHPGIRDKIEELEEEIRRQGG